MTMNYKDAAALRISKISQIRFGAITHGFNTGQVFLPLSLTLRKRSEAKLPIEVANRPAPFDMLT
jgi:hypothetical protein